MAQVHNQPEEVGKILVKVHEDLRQLKEQVDLFKLSGKEIDIKAIDEALQRTEIGLQKNANHVFNAMNSKVQTLPAIGQLPVGYGQTSMDGGMSRNSHQSVAKPLQANVSPGEKCLGELTMKALINPENFNNRSILNRNYGLVLPKINNPKSSRSSKTTGQIVSNLTVDHLAVMPLKNRRDPSLPPPPIEEKDAKRGILSLIQRGLIPPASELTLDPSPVHQKQARLHCHSDSTRRDQYANASSMGGEDSNIMSTVKLDLSQNFSQSVSRTDLADATSGALVVKKAVRISTLSKEALSLKLFEPQLKTPPATPSNTESRLAIDRRPSRILEEKRAKKKQKEKDEENEQHFNIFNGQMPEDSDKSFRDFREKFVLRWGSILKIVQRLVALLLAYAVERAQVNKERLAALAVHYELEHYPSKVELLSVLGNALEVTALVETPGRRFKAANGRKVAAVQIQASWRRYAARKDYQKYRRQRWASALIALTWIMHDRKMKMRKLIKHNREIRLNNHRIRAKTLASNWVDISSGPRVVVHVPSLGYSMKNRERTNGFIELQNLQIGRIFEILDKNIDVIYVSPVEMTEDLTSYYMKMLSLRGGGSSDDVTSTAKKFEGRITFIYPEHAKLFETHKMSLATILHYSPIALNRIKKLITGRNAVYLPGYVNHNDLTVADFLGLAILGSEPEISRLYSSKSGARRIFSASSVEVPPGDFDIYTAQQLHESLSRLICDHPHVKKWLLKIDSTRGGRGIAYLDVERHLPCYEYMMQQVKKFEDKWSRRWAQEEVYSKVVTELPFVLDKFARTVDESSYPLWTGFLEDYLSTGGIIEAYPSSVVTCLTVDMFIAPSGEATMLSCGDQLHAESALKCFATTVPQFSIEPKRLVIQSMKIASAARSRGIVGHFTIDFVTFIDEKTYVQNIWATDLTLTYSDQLAMTRTLLYCSGGTFNPLTSKLTVPPRISAEKRFEKRSSAALAAAERKRKDENLNRIAVMSSQLFHSNLRVIHHSVFFKMCQANGIGFDIREHKGTIFFLFDTEKREKLGMLLIGEDLQDALEKYAKSLSVIHQEISAPKMQGDSNFKQGIHNIENILDTFIVED